MGGDNRANFKIHSYLKKGAITMEAIKTYLDNIFKACPQTHETQALKRNMLDNMDEKYSALRQCGKSEQEAAYEVISNFGNIEEITAELEYNAECEGHDEKIFLTWKEVQIYLTKAKKHSVLIGLGVWLILAGISFVTFLNNAIIMFLIVATAVIIFVLISSRMYLSKCYRKMSIQFDLLTLKKIESECEKLKPRYTAVAIFSVILIIFSIGLFVATNFPIQSIVLPFSFGVITVGSSFEFLLPLFMNSIGLSAFLLIVANSYVNSYYFMMGRKIDSGAIVIKKIVKIVRTILFIACGYWPLILIIYLLWSFVGNAWHISWVIWTIAGILFASIVMGVTIWLATKPYHNECPHQKDRYSG